MSFSMLPPALVAFSARERSAAHAVISTWSVGLAGSEHFSSISGSRKSFVPAEIEMRLASSRMARTC